MLMRTLLYSI
uniref:Uncharacterized protein n=1 Tax=Anguilla anguilla TaxID=7936 RepID=A0A0E9T1Z0_ANGAN